jgi:hypothetical protein
MKWNNKKTKRVETFTPSEEGIIEFINLEDTMHLIPQRISIPKWYKDVPPYAKLFKAAEHKDMTVKMCVPVLDALTIGYQFVTAYDYTFSYNKETNESNFTGPANAMDKKPITMHSMDQVSTLSLSPEYINYVYKWSNSWLIKTPPGYSCLFTHPLDGVEAPFKTLDGVVDTDKFFLSVLFPFLMKNTFEGTIPAGTPIVQVIPFKRDNWKMKVTNNISDELKTNVEAEKNFYMARQYNDGKLDPGIYKREYRTKKMYQ